MKTNRLLLVLAVLFVVHSLFSVAAYQLFSTTTRTPLPVNSTTVETTTPEERARGQSSFQRVYRSERVTYARPRWVVLYANIGYAVLGVALVIALIGRLRRGGRRESV